MAAEEELPAWSLPAEAVDRIALPARWPERVTREWAWGESTGKGGRVCVLGAGFTGSGTAMLAGLRWSIEQGFDVINMSLSTTKQKFAALLHELADNAYFKRTILVASAHNMPVESLPWKFSSVISVGSHEEEDPLAFFYNPKPPVEFFARGVDVELAWLEGGTIRATGNSFATPHIAGICALVMAAHPELTPFQLKSVLYLVSNNLGGGR